MPTTLLKPPSTETHTTLLEQHKADILSGGDGLTSGRKLGLLLGEIQANVATFARRTKLAHELHVVVPQLETEAREARDRSDQLLGLAERPFAETTSSDWLVALGLPVGTMLQQFGQGIVKHFDDRLKSKQRAQDAAMRANGLREQATRGLWETASAALHDQLSDTRIKMLQALKQIEAADKWLGEIDGKVARCRDRCERLFRNEHTDNVYSQQGGPRRRYEAAKDELLKLQAEAKTRPQVEADKARNIKEHAAALALRNQTLAAMLLPENMRWHGCR